MELRVLRSQSGAIPPAPAPLARPRSSVLGRRPVFGVIVGDRGFFPDHLAQSGRQEIIAALEQAGIEAVLLGTDESKYGAVETREDAKRCAALFAARRDTLDGMLITLPNFGD